MNDIARLDHQYVWHPFTQMQDWLRQKPIVISHGKGAQLFDIEGRRYLDANASIWTNLHGHCHPAINAAVKAQLGKIAHSSALGLANVPSSFLAEQLIKAAAFPKRKQPQLSKVFYSDDGSTAMEVALKLTYEFIRRTREKKTPRFLSVSNAYHGDTIGAVSLGHIPLFHAAWRGLLFKSESIPSPYCYRCPHNKAKPERADAREYRKCGWECITRAEKKFQALKKNGKAIDATVVEPVMQGAAGMIAQPRGWLQKLAEIARAHGSLIVADEVMTGFGRTGPTFACHKENVVPDLLSVAKGMTGGYLPMAATLVTQPLFDAFLGDYSEFKTFFHGHSFTGNQLGSAASLASLKLVTEGEGIRASVSKSLGNALKTLWDLPHVGDIRQEGTMAGVELVRDWRTRAPFKLEEQVGINVCRAMAQRGVLTRPIGNVVVLMPPYCASSSQIEEIVDALRVGLEKMAGGRPI